MFVLSGPIARRRTAARVCVPSPLLLLELLLVLLGCLLLSRQECGLMQVDMRLAKSTIAVGELRCAI